MHKDAKFVYWAFCSFCEDTWIKITKGKFYIWAYNPHLTGTAVTESRVKHHYERKIFSLDELS